MKHSTVGDRVGGLGLRRIVTVINERGLHARAAAKFVKVVERFDAEVTVTRNDMAVSGRSIMGLMMLAAAPGAELELSATGAEADAAINALAGLIASRFDEA